MKIYTKTGDQGTTGLLGGTRVKKHHIRIESYGTIDELNAHLGLIRDQNIPERYKKNLIHIQQQLFAVGAMLAIDPKKTLLKNGKPRWDIPMISNTDTQFLETEIDHMTQSLPAMTHFILPGGHQTVSFCHIARCVCRRAERLTTALHATSPIATEILTYLNRLSDYLFVLARKLSETLQAETIKWNPQKPD